MERRRLLATAGALSVTAFATTVCLGANFGLFGLTQPDSPVGRLDERRAVAVQANVAGGSSGATGAIAVTTTTTTPLADDADD